MQPESDYNRLLAALRGAWQTEHEGVQRFGLSYDAGGIRVAYGGWIVPVASGIASGSAHELTRLLDRLSELAEAETSLSVNVMLDPAKIGLPPVNGNHGSNGPKR